MATYLPTMLIGRTPDQVLRELRRRSVAGELHSAGPGVVAITNGPHAGRYGIPVYLRDMEHTRPASWWTGRRIAAGVTLTLGGFGALVWWVLSTLTATALAALLLAILAAFVYGTHRATRVQVTTTTTTRMTVR